MEPQTSTDTIWRNLNSDLRRFIRGRVSDDHTADDQLQETFIRIHKKLETLQDADRLAAWVYQIARNVIHDHHRRSAKQAVSLADDPLDQGNQRECDRKNRTSEWLGEIIRQLPDAYKDEVCWSEIDGLPQQEVADRLGLSLSGAKSRIQRGRALLKERLDQCCRFEFDQRGNLMNCDPKPAQTVCQNCEQ